MERRSKLLLWRNTETDRETLHWHWHIYKYSLSAPDTNWGYLNVATLASLKAQKIATFATFNTQDVAMPKKRRLD